MQDIQQQDKYETDSDNESDEEGDFEVVYGRTCRDQFGKISTRSLQMRLDLWGLCHIDDYTIWI